MRKWFYLSVLTALFLAACGDEITEVNEQKGMKIIAGGEELPDCTKDNVGEIAYVTDSSDVYYCVDGKWLTLKGEDGDDGKDGENGKDGVSSKDTVIVTKKDTIVVVVKDSSVVRDTSVIHDTTMVKDTVYLEYVPKYDTVTTEYLNQEMLAEGKYGILVDSRDNKVYRTIEIGGQTWMAQNLDFDKDGIYSYCPNNSLDDCKKYGRLYRWAQAMNLDDSYNTQRATGAKGADSILFRPTRGICPAGFHIPDSTEMAKLESYVKAYNTIYYPDDDIVSSLMSKNEAVDWKSTSGKKATDRYGFAGMGAGGLNTGKYTWYNEHVYFWTATETASNGNAYNAGLLNTATVFRYNNCTKLFFLSVRCIKN